MLFWFVTLRWLVVVYQCFGTTRQSNLQGMGQAVLPWKKESIGFFKNLTNKYHPVLLNIAEE